MKKPTETKQRRNLPESRKFVLSRTPCTCSDYALVTRLDYSTFTSAYTEPVHSAMTDSFCVSKQRAYIQSACPTLMLRGAYTWSTDNQIPGAKKS
jgi:hypothetical protein